LDAAQQVAGPSRFRPDTAALRNTSDRVRG
jgi:hypothetical protein